MKTKIIFLSLAFTIIIDSFSQDNGTIETIGAGVIEFLLTTPKTANKLDETQYSALLTVGKVLEIFGQRKHDIKTAAAGSDQIIINTSSGEQVKVIQDVKKNLYLLKDGVIYPVTSSLVAQAEEEKINPSSLILNKSVQNATLPDYDFSRLKNEYVFDKEKSFVEKESWERYTLSKRKESLNSIASKFKVSNEDIFFVPYLLKGGGKHQSFVPHKYSLSQLSSYSKKAERQIQKLYDSNKLLIRTSLGCQDFLNGWLAFYFSGYKKMKLPNGFAIFIRHREIKHSLKYEIKTAFTCNWVKDFDGNGKFGLEEFHGIKRSFYKDEKQLFVMGYTSEMEGTWKLEIYEASTGKRVYRDSGNAPRGAQILTVEKEGEKFPPNIYVYNFNLKNANNSILSKSEKFEIMVDKSNEK